jgi:enoyl-CoA hydratase/carnithine racemase
MPLNYQTLNYSPASDTILKLGLNRPDAANALNTQMALELADAFSYLSEITNKYRVVILHTESKHFCAGADLKERKGMNVADWKRQHKAFREARDAILGCQLPVIAAVQGAAYGGGLELALACDFIYASDDARFALTEATLGIMPGMGGTQTLARAIGKRHARELMFTGKAFSAQDAHAMGMINHLCSRDTLMSEVLACAETIAANAPLSIKNIKSAINEGMHLPLSEALDTELSHYNTLLNTKDRHEGINAFNEKRTAIFTGE